MIVHRARRIDTCRHMEHVHGETTRHPIGAADAKDVCEFRDGTNAELLEELAPVQLNRPVGIWFSILALRSMTFNMPSLPSLSSASVIEHLNVVKDAKLTFGLTLVRDTRDGSSPP